MTTIRQILNAAKWKDENLHLLTLVVTHRGAPGGQRLVAANRVEEIGGEGLRVRGDSPEDTFIPYHRVLEVRSPAGTCLWDRAGGLRDIEPLPKRQGTERRTSVDVVVDADILTIDGSAGEGGGQILRTSLTLSMLTGRPFRLVNIRAGRRKPGLKRQHLTCINAAAAISGATVGGAKLHSAELRFEPGSVESGEYAFDVGTAGSVALVLQTVALPLALAGAGDSTVEIRGGTHAKWAPPVPFLQEAWLPVLERMGLGMDLRMSQAGFFPAGGGSIRADIRPGALHAIHLRRASEDLNLEAHAIVSDLAEGIARRELLALETAIAGHPAATGLSLHAATVRSPGPGNACWLIARSADLANVFSTIGDKSIKAEDVALGVAHQFETWATADVAADEYLADQLLLPLALAKGGSFTTTKPSLHTWTNIEVIAAFGLPRFHVEEHDDSFELRV